MRQRLALATPTPILLSAMLASCGGAAASNLARAIVDTLPGGVLRVTSSGPTAWTDSGGPRMVEAGRWSGADGTAEELGQPRSLAVDETGRIYVVDSKPAAIKVFSPDGTLIRTLGREGEGPGEFRVGFIAVGSGHLVLHDPQISRTSVWDTAGTFLRSWPSACCYWMDIQIDRAARIYIPGPVPPRKDKAEERRGQPYARWTLEGQPVDTVWVPRGTEEKYWTVSLNRGGKNQRRMMTTIPFQPGQTHTLDPNGGVVYAWTGNYSIVRSTTGADSVRVFGRAWTADPVTDERRTGELEARIKGAAESWGEATVRAAFKSSDIPSTLPAFMSLRVDQASRVWARRYPVADTTRTSFDVFDSTGAYLGPVTVGFKMSDWGLQAWTRDGVVTLIEDSDGRPTIVRLRFTP